VITETGQRANLLLPAGTFAEADGTLVSSEGRAQRFFRLLVPEGDIQESWRWLRDALQQVPGRASEANWPRMDDVIAACAEAVPMLAAIRQAAPTANFRIAGSKIPREPHRYSGRTAVDADVTVHEPKPPDDPDTPLAFSMEGYYGPMPAPIIPYFWAPSWNSVQALNKFQDEVGGPLRGGDPGIRLIEPGADAASRYFQDVPDAFVRNGKWLIVPLHEIFGSEELSCLAPAVSDRIPAPYIALNPEDAASLRVTEGAIVSVNLGATTCRLPVRMRAALPSGVAGMPVGLSGSISVDLPAWGTVAGDGASFESRAP
jgi:NADH-quinone oxidoreductase subunit G